MGRIRESMLQNSIEKTCNGNLFSKAAGHGQQLFSSELHLRYFHLIYIKFSRKATLCSTSEWVLQ